MKNRSDMPLAMMAVVMLLASVVSGCLPVIRPDNRLRYSPVAAEVNGVLYSSGEFEYPSAEWHPSFEFVYDEKRFAVTIERSIFSDVGEEAALYIHVSEDAPFELNKKYLIEEDNRNYCSINDIYSVDGYVLFTGLHDDSLSGIFEFTAVDEATGETIEVRNGIFENLWI